MNDYIKLLKENLSGFSTTINSQNLYLAQDRKNYAGDLLEQKVNEHNNKKQLAYQKFQKDVQNSFENIKKALSKASFIDPVVVQSPIAKLLNDGNVKLTDYELQTYLDKANSEHNFTMLRMIKNYAEKNHLTPNIYDAPTILETYKKFYSSALQLANNILMSDSIINNELISSFADENFSKPLFDVLGNALFPQQELSDEYAHSFDDISLND